MNRQHLKTAVIREITQETARDKQRRVGPSDLGGCPHCLGRKMAGAPDELDEFSLFPWIGTGVHSYLETSTFPDAKHELKLEVGEVPGYGTIKGTTDLYLPWDDGGGTVVDWKIVGLKKLKTYRLNGVSNQYRYQGQLYGRGCELAGYSVDSVAICFIPRDSGNVNDIWIHEEAYQPEMAQKALDRAEKIWNIVQADGWEGIESDPDCWTCNNTWR